MEKSFGYWIILMISRIIAAFSSGFLLISFLHTTPVISALYWLTPMLLSGWTILALHGRKMASLRIAALLLLAYALSFAPVLIIPVLVETGILMFDRQTRACLTQPL